ncbi:hypothetical protein [Streptomyces sp. NPDC096033]|uniref:hypothetical protein n=1 Tax=Streptomyces sp. NPDC096033 TaxID=3366071 RepID=UPI0037F8BCAD
MIIMKRVLAVAAVAGAFLGMSGASHAADNDPLPPLAEASVLRSNGPGVSQHYLKAASHDQSGTVTHAIFVRDKSQATVWFIDSNGRLAYGNPAPATTAWTSYTVGSGAPGEILQDASASASASASGPFLTWAKHSNGNVAGVGLLRPGVPFSAS